MTKTLSNLLAPSADLPAVKQLLQMHTYARPHRSSTETTFRNKYIRPLGDFREDEEGNLILRLGAAPVLWSSHTDTVHRKEGRLKLTYGGGILGLSKAEDANCLGADCTVGVWLMTSMIERGVEGLYVFHAGEEVGGIGSDHIACKTPELLAGIDYAIALDRKGTQSVITHQMGRCCSDGFAEALAGQLGTGFEKDDSGTFTDTANYVNLVPECTNISVGYYGQHTPSEVLDVGFAVDLLERLCAIDVGALPVLRDPSVKSNDFWGHSRWFSEPKKHVAEDLFTSEDFDEDLATLAFENPDVIAEIFRDYGIAAADVRDYVEKYNQRWRH